MRRKLSMILDRFWWFVGWSLISLLGDSRSLYIQSLIVFDVPWFLNILGESWFDWVTLSNARAVLDYIGLSSVVACNLDRIEWQSLIDSIVNIPFVRPRFPVEYCFLPRRRLSRFIGSCMEFDCEHINKYRSGMGEIIPKYVNQENGRNQTS